MTTDPTSNRSKILVVEDELIVAADLILRLQKMGYQVVGQADEGRLAIKYCQESQPDLVLMDIRLKGELDGISVASQIHSMHKIPVVFLTAHADESTLQRAKITEPYGYILKPFDERELRIVVEVALYRSKIDKQLAQSQQFLAAILNSIADAVFVVDANLAISYLNPAADRLTLPRKTKVGVPLADLIQPMDPISRNPISVVEMLKLTHGSQDSEILVQSVDSDELRFFVSIAHLRLDDRSPDSMVILLRDVTQQYRLEEDLRQAQRMESLGQLAAGIAHDLNNLLTVVCINNALLCEDPNVSDEHGEMLANITQATDRATKITQQLLAIAKKQVIQIRVIDLSDTIRNCEELIRRLVSPLVCEAFDLTAEPLPIKADRSQIEQVLFNLAIHARSSMIEGGKVTVTSRCIKECSELDGRSAAVVEIADNGKGMDEETRSRIWEPFYGDNRDGTGLGLAVVYGIIKQFAGEVSLQSELGRGSVFRVFIPLASEQQIKI